MTLEQMGIHLLTPDEEKEERLALKLCSLLEDDYSWSRYAHYQIFSCGNLIRDIDIYECKFLEGLRKTVRYEVCCNRHESSVSYDYCLFGRPHVHLDGIVEAAKLIRKENGGSPVFC